MTASRILLFGGAGQVGSELRRALVPLGDVVAPASGDCDIADPSAVGAIFEAVRPEIVVNAAAFTAVDTAEAEADRAFLVNAEAPGRLADIAALHGALLVHYSTDYVFDGTKPEPYVEEDATAPLSVYGRSKLEGEERVRAAGGAHLILRTSWVYGHAGRNFPRAILRRALAGEPLKVVADQTGAPTPAALIANVTARCIERYLADAPSWRLTGLYHLTAAGGTTWHGAACRVVEAAQAVGMAVKAGAGAIEAISSADRRDAARRPANSRLACDRLETAFSVALPDWGEGIDCFVRELAEKDVTTRR